MNRLVIYIGYDPKEEDAYKICEKSIQQTASKYIEVRPLRLDTLTYMGIMTRKVEKKAGRLWDEVSNHYMSTEFAISRFAIPLICNDYQWALFMDCDMLVRSDIWKLDRYFDPKYAILCTQHNHIVSNGSIKMDNQIQLSYDKKNWSSFCLWNLKHPANDRLSNEMLNTYRGLDLHQFCWLKDEEIGSIPLSWNYLVGHNVQSDFKEINNVHFTEGVPSMEGYENCEFSDEWKLLLEQDKELSNASN